MYTKEFISSIRARVLLSDVISMHTKIMVKNNKLSALCPFHSEKTPSFVINNGEGFYHCFGCNTHGDIFTFVSKIHNYNFIHSVEYICSNFGISLPQKKESILQNIFNFAHKFFMENFHSSPVALNYFLRRGYTKENCQYMGIGFATEGNSLSQFLMKRFALQDIIKTGLVKVYNQKYYDIFKNRVLFPIKNVHGNVVSFGGRTLTHQIPKYLNTSENPLFKKSYTVFNYDLAKKKNTHLVIVEGYMDAMAINCKSDFSAVAILGTSITGEQMQKCWKLYSEPIICFDGDDAGKKAAIKALYTLLPLINSVYSCKFLFLPQGEDPDSLISNGVSIEIGKAFTVIEFLIEIFFKKSNNLIKQFYLINQEISKIQDPQLVYVYKEIVKKEVKGQIWRRKDQPIKVHDSADIKYNLILGIFMEHPTLIDKYKKRLEQLPIYNMIICTEVAYLKNSLNFKEHLTSLWGKHKMDGIVFAMSRYVLLNNKTLSEVEVLLEEIIKI